MKVRVKRGKIGFIYGLLRKEYDEFSLKPAEHSTELDDKGDPVVISEDRQFSNEWMEKVEVKAKPGPKPKKQKEPNKD